MNNKIITSSLLTLTTLAMSACAPVNNGPVTPHNAYTRITTAPVPMVPPPVVPASVIPTSIIPASIIPASVPVAAPVPVATAPAEQYVVQLTASNSQQKAQGISAKFAADGYNTFVNPLNVNGKLLHRVQIGMFNGQTNAKMALAQMKAKYPSNPYVMAAITKKP